MRKISLKRAAATAGAMGCALLFAVCGVVLAALANGREYARVNVSSQYYFLVKECETTTAVAVSGEVHASGGAGYYLQEDNAVALACYYTEAQAEEVQESLKQRGADTLVVRRACEGFSLRGNKSRQAGNILNNARTVNSLARLLFDTANGLECSSLSQEQAKAALYGVSDSLSGLIAQNGDALYEGWNGALREAANGCKEVAGGLVFARDLRYLQASLCDNVVNLANFFL